MKVLNNENGVGELTELGGFAFSCFWGILEMFQQERRVVKGWFPENPKRHEYYERLRTKANNPAK
ncbi:MAG: DUF4491 family protein [Bacteroidales bacterium]|nr:DUF4491 family protein [Bacteroidales bacterium]